MRVGGFLCCVQSKGSDKVDVEAIYCQSVLDNTATGEILDRFSILLDRIYVESLELEGRDRKKAALLSAISGQSF